MALFFTNGIRTRFTAAALLLGMLVAFAGIVPQPARADGAASTRNIILGTAAAIAGVVIYNNIHHKQLAHDTVVGHTANGGTIYADGRVVYPNGDVLYTGRNGRPCSYDGYGPYCGDDPVVYYPRGYAGEHHDNGRHRGWYKHHGRDYDDENDDGDRGHGHGHGDHDR
jgi:hypothetical protein